MKMFTIRGVTVCLLAGASCVVLGAGCIRPTLIGGANTGPNPLDGFNGTGNSNGTGNGSDNSSDDPVNSNGSDDDDSNPINPLNPFGLEVQFTDARVDSLGWIQAGDDLIVVGTGVGSRVQYLIPSDPNPVATDISDVEVFAVSGFAVLGKWIILRNLDGEVFVFNVETTTLTAINPDEFAVAGGIAKDAWDFRADGDYVAAIMDRERTTDDFLIKLLKLDGPSPEIITIMQNPPGTSDPLEPFEAQLALDGDQLFLAAQVNDHIYFYNNFLVNLAPTPFDFTAFGGVSNQKPMWLENVSLMYLAREQSPEGHRLIYVARLSLGVTSPAPVNPATFDEFEMNNGQFGYFAVQSDSDQLLNRQARSVFGRVFGSGPSVDSDAINNMLVGDDRDDGVFGFGQTLSLSPNGEYRFLAGGGADDAADLLQISKDVTWEVFNDPRATDESGPYLRATDVSTSDSVCGFVTGADRMVGYILLD
jgi:hypothetical protein